MFNFLRKIFSKKEKKSKYSIVELEYHNFINNLLYCKGKMSEEDFKELCKSIRATTNPDNLHILNKYA